MQQTSERAHHLQSSLIRDVAEKGMQMQDILPLWFGEGQWPTSQIAIEAAQNALLAGDHFYQPNNGKPRLRSALAHYMNGLYGTCLLYTSPSPRDATLSRMPSSA